VTHTSIKISICKFSSPHVTVPLTSPPTKKCKFKSIWGEAHIKKTMFRHCTILQKNQLFLRTGSRRVDAGAFFTNQLQNIATFKIFSFSHNKRERPYAYCPIKYFITAHPIKFSFTKLKIRLPLSSSHFLPCSVHCCKFRFLSLHLKKGRLY
jgi:hypothetical protein